MTDAPSNRWRLAAAVFLVAVAVAVVAVYLRLPSGSRSLALAVNALIAATCIVSGVVIALAIRRGAWRGSGWLAWTLLLLGSINALLFVLDVSDLAVHPRHSVEFLFLVLLLPLVGLAGAESRAHLGPSERRELGIDSLLITASLTAILYLVIRPVGASPRAALSAGAFALLAAAQLTLFCSIAVWVPTRSHLVQALTFAALAAATAGLGWQWSQHRFDTAASWIDLTFALAPLVLAAMVTVPLPSADMAATRPRRWTRPVLTSIAVVSACAALAMVAIFAEASGIQGLQSIVIIGLLGLSVAARIIANQVASTQAHRQVRSALADKDAALNKTDQALERVRETNEILRQSEEHLRLIFDAAVDGVAELDERGVVLRANEALCRMVGLDRGAIEQQPWSALAAVVTGADERFAALPNACEAEIQRNDGQPLFLESRVSQIPATTPRTLMVVRDVTSARIADQTIRSLFQFLQDRDEDRTRLLRRTNSAIEAERNRVARDLHDGPVQGVSAASLSLEAALLMIKAGETDRGLEVLSRVREELTAEADALRRLMSGLRPPVLEERGLVPALREMVARFGEDRGVHTEFSGRIGVPLPEDLETLAYRVVQEALSNASKYAEASMLTVSVETDTAQLRIEIQDDGRGFDVGRTREFLREGRVGLASMRERVELASGTFVARSSPNRGTTLMANLPIGATDTHDRELAVHEAT